MTHSTSIHVSTNDSISFLLMAEEYSIVYMYHHFLIHWSVDGHLGCFRVLAIVNSVRAGFLKIPPSVALYICTYLLPPIASLLSTTWAGPARMNACPGAPEGSSGGKSQPPVTHRDLAELGRTKPPSLFASSVSSQRKMVTVMIRKN